MSRDIHASQQNEKGAAHMCSGNWIIAGDGILASAEFRRDALSTVAEKEQGN
jgi:hypothetical protein